MELKLIKPRNATKHLLKLRPERKEVDSFKENLNRLLGQIDDKKSEENQKNNIRDFLRETYYKAKNEVNTKERADLVIHSGKDGDTPVSVLIETKRPTNKSEMIAEGKLNVKAFHEIVLYFLREWFEKKNLEVKYAIITNVNEWYIIDAKYLKSIFVDTKFFVRQYDKWRKGQTTASTNDVFYKDILAPFIESHEGEIEAVYFNINDYKKELKDSDKDNDRKLLSLYKLLSPYYLLREPYANDSNSLNKGFYNELLHIIGVKEQKEKGKAVIDRLPKGERNYGSLLENALDRLETEDPLGRVENLSLYGNNYKEQQFNIALELCITWVNRVLFLKLLEGQLLNFHKGDKAYRFLHIGFIKNFDMLYKLFHDVLAVDIDNRKASLAEKYKHIPYLNSSLFDFSPLEAQTLKVSSLEMGAEMPVSDKTVLKDEVEKGEKLDTLEYLFRFLDAYDFSSVDKEDIQEDKRGLINASVLGKIFEKINGYKDGSIFTPGFITMYMSREALRRAVVQKLNEHYNWDCEEYSDLHNYLNIRKAKDVLIANGVINSLKICDPAVGSGHFLVSVMNELIAIKSDLGLLADENGQLLKDYTVEVVDDELIVTNYEGEPYSYNPKDDKSLRIQKTLFHEKQTIIENCLFGVDINPNSVKICRLRLWIELLKNAYYKEEGVLETLPNIDINIKVGNSLLSRFALDDDLSEAFKAQKYSLETYKVLIDTYRHSRNHKEKDELLKLIEDIKSEYTQTIFKKDPRRKKIADLRGQLVLAKNKYNLFGEKLSADKQELEEKRLKKLLAQKEKELEEAESGAMYKNAFEWRFEFPEVLDKDGNFIGFDVVIGNPPYIRLQEISVGSKEIINFYKNTYRSAAKGNFDIYVLFDELGYNILNANGNLTYIQPHKFFQAEFGANLRDEFIKTKSVKKIVHFGHNQVFNEASTYTCILFLTKEVNSTFEVDLITDLSLFTSNQIVSEQYSTSFPDKGDKWVFMAPEKQAVINTMRKQPTTLEDVTEKIFVGLQTSADKVYVLDYVSQAGDIVKCYSNQLNEEVEIEENLLKPFLMGKDVKRYNVAKPIKKVIFPYKVVNDKAELMTSKYIKAEFPKGWEYLLRNKSVLEGREKGKMVGAKFYAYIYPKNLIEFDANKIMTPDIASRCEFAYDTKNLFHTTTVYSIRFISNVKEKSQYYIGLLNSKILWFFLRNTGNVLRGGYFRFKTEYLNPFPIKRIDFSVNDEAAKHDRIVELVDKILAAKEKRPDADTTAWEAEIDQLVYQLYGLTEEEIKIVEGG